MVKAKWLLQVRRDTAHLTGLSPLVNGPQVCAWEAAKHVAGARRHIRLYNSDIGDWHLRCLRVNAVNLGQRRCDSAVGGTLTSFS